MNLLLSKLNHRFSLLEDTQEINTLDLPRQTAEDRLFHTIGPLTDSPRWYKHWTGEDEPPPDFVPNGPAPHWTPEAVIYAMAGDPNLLFKSYDDPRSPMAGDRGGSPLYRTAKRIAKHYGRGQDKQFISDLYSLGFIPLLQMMQPGFDESRSPFISYVMRYVQGAMENGVGGTERGKRAKGAEIDSGGLVAMLKITDPEQVRELANQVKGEFQTAKSHAKHQDNPYAQYSSRYYQAAMAYAAALESDDEQAITAARKTIENLVTTIEDEQIVVPGASTGAGQAISTPDRRTRMKMQSLDVPAGDSGESMAGSVAADNSESEDPRYTPETIKFVFELALTQNVGAVLGNIPRYQKMAAAAGAKVDGNGKPYIGGPLTVNELRYVARAIGPLGSNYPGRGVPRKNITIPRDSPGWWQAGEDPEIEPLPNGGLWHSIWSRRNWPEMGSTEIAQEMTEEVREFQKLGVATNRAIKAKVSSRGEREEVVSKVAVGNTAKQALIKLKLIAYANRGLLDQKATPDDQPEEMAEEGRRPSGLPILEGYDRVDRLLIAETCDFIINRVQRLIMLEKAPPGWSGTVKAMKKHMSVDDAFARAWAMYKSGSKPHHKPEKSKSK